jgi:hypothetical protein
MMLGILAVIIIVSYLVYSIVDYVKMERYLKANGPGRIIKKNVDGKEYYVVEKLSSFHEWHHYHTASCIEDASQHKNFINDRYFKRKQEDELFSTY